MRILWAAAFGLAAIGAAQFATPAAASTLQLETFSGDSTFTSRCGGTDTFGCEFAVSEGRVGDGTGRGTWEAGVWDRVSNPNTLDNANAAEAITAGVPYEFSLSYVATGAVTTFEFLGTTTTGNVDFSAGAGPDNPSGPAQTLYIRTRFAGLTGLTINGHLIGDGTLSNPSDPDPQYIAIGGVDLTADWTLEGFAFLDPARNGSGSAFQVKVTDLAPIPVPPGIALLAGGLGLFGLLRRRQRVRA